MADEGVDRAIVLALRAAGHDLDYVAEFGSGISDTEVLQRARAVSAVLITGDKDFGELVFRQGLVTGGVLLLRLAGLAAEDKVALTSNAVEMHGPEMASAFSVLNPRALRIRH